MFLSKSSLILYRNVQSSPGKAWCALVGSIFGKKKNVLFFTHACQCNAGQNVLKCILIAMARLGMLLLYHCVALHLQYPQQVSRSFDTLTITKFCPHYPHAAPSSKVPCMGLCKTERHLNRANDDKII